MIGLRTRAWAWSGIAACLFGLAVGSVTPAVAQEGAGAGVLMTTTATVRTIDLESRMVTLEDGDGRVTAVHVGPQVINLPQVRPGDRVNVSRYQAVAIDIARPTAGSAPVATQTAEATLAEPGELPYGDASVVTRIAAQVVGLNPAQHTIMVIGPAGGVRTVFVKRPRVRQLLSQLQVGDMVQISFVESEAISVEAAS